MESEEETPLLSLKSINDSLDLSIDDEKVQAVQAQRRRNVDQFLGSLCSYFFICTFCLMIVFGTIFMSHGYNDSVTVTLQTVDESTTKHGMLVVYDALEKLDSSSFRIHVQLVGYNGKCTEDEVSLIIQGCNSMNRESGCIYDLSVFISNSSSCDVLAVFRESFLAQTSTFTFAFSKPDFYAQQVIYNVSTSNTNKTRYHGNSYIYGALQPAAGEILRGNATVEVLTVLTYISDCSSNSSKSEGYFMRGMVRINEEICHPDPYSYKSLSYLSTTIDPVDASLYNYLNVSGFTYNIALVKSPFYKNVAQSYYVSIGAVLSITMLAALDVYWFVEAFVPWLAYWIFKIQSGLLKILNP